jgi:hypothetical protein
VCSSDLDPSNAQAQRDLWVSYSKLGQLRQADGDFDGAAQDFEAGVSILQRMIDAGQLVEQSQTEQELLKQLLSEL